MPEARNTLLPTALTGSSLNLVENAALDREEGLARTVDLIAVWGHLASLSSNSDSPHDFLYA